jgi:hypothetical protein
MEPQSDFEFGLQMFIESTGNYRITINNYIYLTQKWDVITSLDFPRNGQTMDEYMTCHVARQHRQQLCWMCHNIFNSCLMTEQLLEKYYNQLHVHSAVYYLLSSNLNISLSYICGDLNKSWNSTKISSRPNITRSDTQIYSLIPWKYSYLIKTWSNPQSS